MAIKSPSVKLMKPPTKNVPKAEEAPEEVAEQPVKSAPAKKSVTTKSAPAKAAPVEKAEPVEEAAEAEAEAASEVDADDLIVATAHEVENLKSDKAFAMVPKLLDSIDHDYFRLGGVLAAIQAQGWFQDKGHETFRAFVEAECGIAYRKSMYLIQIYTGLVESGIPWDKVKHLGWTKLKELANILSPENVDEWVALAEQVTVLQLQEHIKQATKGAASGDNPEAPDAPKSDTTTMTFKMHADQKETIREALDKAKHETGTEVDTVALEAICIDYLGGSSKLKAVPSLKSLMEGKSVEEVLEAVAEAFPQVELTATMEGGEYAESESEAG